MLLPTPFVHATLIALDLPRDLADRYAAPGETHSRADTDRQRRLAPPDGCRPPESAPPWPFHPPH